MSPLSARVQASGPRQSVRRIRRPHAAHARERAQAVVQFLTGAVVLGAGGATAWIGLLVACDHPGAFVHTSPAQPVSPGSTVKSSRPGNSAPPATTLEVSATTTIPPTTTARRPLVTSGGSSAR